MAEAYRSGFAALIGRPNAGKSTLINRLVGQKVAIMSDKPQTTRNKILAVLTTSAYQIVFLDTPGMHKPQHQLGVHMVAVARAALADADVVLYVVDAAVEPGRGEEYIIEDLKKTSTPVILVLNKVDLVDRVQLVRREQFFRARLDFKAVRAVSALEGINVAALPEIICNYLSPGPRFFPEEMVTDQPEKLIIAELIREQVLQVTREEVPHAVAVVVTEVARRPNDYLYVEATIYIERDSQKGIIIGQGGQRLKEIGSQARHEVEALLGNKIYLNLHVRVKKNWRRQEPVLRQMGYNYR